MTDLDRAHEASQSVQFELAEFLLQKKRPTLDELFNMLGAAMTAQEYLRKQREAANAE